MTSPKSPTSPHSSEESTSKEAPTAAASPRRYPTSVILTASGLLGVIMSILGYYYRNETADLELHNRMRLVLDGLLRAERLDLPKGSYPPRVAVGFGACRDVIVPAMDVMERVGAQPPSSEPQHYDNIDSMEKFQNMFAYFFQHGAAAERYISNMTLFDELVSAAWASESVTTILGGNAPVMAKRFKQEGCHVLLGATATEELRTLIQEDIIVAGEVLESDDIHLSLEYKKDEAWGPYSASRANRFFFHHDRRNPLLYSLDEFSTLIPEFSPDLLVIGGLQMMDNFPFEQGQRSTLLQSLSSFLEPLSGTIPVHFEMASFGEAECLADVVRHVILPHTASLGMNEQELPALLAVINAMDQDNDTTVPLVSDTNPRIAATLDGMRDLYHLLRKKQATLHTNGGVTRIHVHTLAFQAVLTTHESSWKPGVSAAAHASLTAHRHVCATGQVDVQKSRLLMDEGFTTSTRSSSDVRRIPFRSDHPVECWHENDEGHLVSSDATGGGGYQLCVAPVLVCTDVVQTGGGGDNISSAALAKQI